MKKIYCPNCEHFLVDCYSLEACVATENTGVEETNFIDTYKNKAFSEFKTIYKKSPDVLNRWNDCKYYKRLWWKWWVE